MSKSEVEKLKNRITSLECDLGMVCEQAFVLSCALDDAQERLEGVAKRDEAKPVMGDLWRIKGHMRLIRQAMGALWVDVERTLEGEDE